MLKAATIILAILFAFAAAYSIVVLAVPSITLEGDFRAMTGRDYKEALDEGAVQVAFVHIRHMEVNGLTATIAGFFILFAAFRQAQRWSWWAMLVLGAVAWGAGVALNLFIGNRLDSAVFLVGLVLHLLALFLPLRRFFARTV
jgi:hypothetical protein